MAPHKRPYNAIDLTGDEPRKQSRTAHGASQSSRVQLGSSQDAPLVIDDGEEEDGSQEAPDASQGYNEAEYSYGLYGEMTSKIVGCRFYNGYATVGEMVIIRREPNNPYDSR